MQLNLITQNAIYLRNYLFFRIFLCQLLTLVAFSYRSKLTLIPTMVLKILQFRNLTRNFNTHQVVFLRFILGCGNFYKVTVRDIFMNFLRFCKHKKRDSFVNFVYFLTVTESFSDGRMLCCFCILKTKNKHAICEICFDVIVEFVLDAQIMGTY